MKLVSCKELLEEARREKKAIAAINVSNMETIYALLEVATKQSETVIIQVSPIQLQIHEITYKFIVKMIQLIGEEFDIIAAIHLDHGTTVEECIQAIDAGFTSVMYDGSLGSYEKNVENTKKVVEYAKVHHVSVEAELGRVGGTEGLEEDNSDHRLTSVKQVSDFLTQCDIDSLAVSIGNAHGIYQSEPNLNFIRLEEISKVSKVPLVLHGGTGISDEDIKKCISLGICKINYFTEVDQAFVKGFVTSYLENNKIYMMKAAQNAKNEMKQIIEHKIKVCNTEMERK